jgi:hypothetical protein
MAIENTDNGPGRLSSEYTSWRQPTLKVAINDHDRDVILRVVATEVAHQLRKSHPEQYEKQIAGVIDTMINRVGSGQFLDTFEKVANQRRAFTKITGPESADPYGSVDKVPGSAIPPHLKAMVDRWIDLRLRGQPSSVGGNLNYGIRSRRTKRTGGG